MQLYPWVVPPAFQNNDYPGTEELFIQPLCPIHETSMATYLVS